MQVKWLTHNVAAGTICSGTIESERVRVYEYDTNNASAPQVQAPLWTECMYRIIRFVYIDGISIWLYGSEWELFSICSTK